MIKRTTVTLLLSMIIFSFHFYSMAQDSSGKKEAAQNRTGEVDSTEALDENALPPHVNPNEVRRGIRMGGENGKSRNQVYYERIIKKVEPDLKGKPDSIDRYIDFFKSETIVDKKLFPFSVKGEWGNDNQLVLSGFVGYQENLTSLLNYLKYLGFEKVDSQVEVLPSENLGEMKFAIVKVPYAYSYDKPTSKSEPMTQGLLGDPIYLLKKMANEYYLCYTSEGYVGYISGEHIIILDHIQFTRYQSGPQVYILKNQTKGEELLIPFGARLKSAAEKGSDALVELPDSTRVSIPKGQFEIRQDKINPQIENAIKIADQLMGSDYKWGGKTTDGVDCSGLIQASFRSQGINMPRDAYQQAYVGSLVATRWYMDGLRRGDTLYFVGRSGRINHTALYLGDGQYIEASRGDVHYTSFNPKHENYNERKLRGFCFAKRVLD